MREKQIQEKEMVAPDRLQLLVDLSEGTVEEYTPDVNDTGDVSYPRANQTIEGDARETLEMLAGRDLLYKEFEEKVYLCPSCDQEGMQYTTVCPFCESPYAIEEDLLEHRECKTKRPREEFVEGDELWCPTCDERIAEDEVYDSRGYLCYDCDECSTSPEHRLWCRSCDRITLLENSTERVLCRYGLTTIGEEWIESQLSARETIREALESRGFDTRTDEPVEIDGITGRVHVFGEDPLLDRAVLVDVHERATLDDAEWLRDAADGNDAILVTTSGSVNEQVATFARDQGIKILTVGRDGGLHREFDVTEGEDRPTLIQRLTSAVSQ